MKKLLIWLAYMAAYLCLLIWVSYLIGMFENYTVYTINDILYVDRGVFTTTITSEATLLDINVHMAHNIPLVIGDLSIPCDNNAYQIRVDSLERIY